MWLRGPKITKISKFDPKLQDFLIFGIFLHFMPSYNFFQYFFEKLLVFLKNLVSTF